MIDLEKLKAENLVRWDAAKPIRDFTAVARRLVAPDAKLRYHAVELVTGVPWWFIAVVHQRESSQDWRASLAQGDPWNEVSVHVPAGRGPFTSWEEAAHDALVNCAPHAAKNRDWSPGVVLTLLESYNGLGYASRGLPSPYVWAWTDQYHSGKFIRDGVFDPNVVDGQFGCAGIIKAMMSLDSTVVFAGVAVQQPAPAPPIAKPVTASITSPSKGSIGDFIAGILAAIFKRKT